MPDKEVEMIGIGLDEDRSVYACVADDRICYRFTNKGNETFIKLSPEAINAAFVLYQDLLLEGKLA